MKNRSRRTRRTYRRESARLDQKRERAAARQALNGGRPRLTRRESWSSRPVAAPDIQDELLGEESSSRRIKPSPKKEPDHACPSRDGSKRHHYLTDEEEYPIYGYTKGLIRRRHYRQVGVGRRKIKLCVYCGLEKTTKNLGRELWFDDIDDWRWLCC